MQGMTDPPSRRLRAIALPFAGFLIGFLLLPVRSLGGFEGFPSDEGDGRLNAYFLENVYQFLIGGSPSLWTLGIFHPYPYTLGFSDNLFGAAPIYVIARAVSQDAYLAFVVWWYVGWAATFAGTWWAGRKLGLANLGATTAAFVFTFALPITSMYAWPQFAYRFGTPLAVAAWWVFLRERRWPQLVVAAAWTVWQFYCGIYMGVFTLVILVAVLIGHLLAAVAIDRVRGSIAGLRAWGRSTRALGVRGSASVLAGLAGLAGLMVALLWPYLRVTQIYGLSRSYAEVQVMLPTWRTYLSNYYSLFWEPLLRAVPQPDMAWEHQFFPGLLVIALTALGVATMRRKGADGVRRLDPTSLAMLTALALIVVVTVNIRGYSLWWYVSQLPLFSAIRAVARITIVMLLPLGYLAGRGIEWLWTRRPIALRGLAAVLLAALAVESVAVTPITSPVSAWQASDRAAADVPNDLKPGSVLFVAQEPGVEWWHSEVTSMWAALRRGVPTINGYSGAFPPGFTPWFGGDCAQLPARVQAHLAFTGRTGDLTAYRAEMAPVVPVGFSSCQASWWTAPPIATATGPGPTDAEFAALKVAVGSRTPRVTRRFSSAEITIANPGSTTIAAGGSGAVRIWHRYVDAAGTVITAWVGNGVPLAYDLAPGDVGTVSLPIDSAPLVSGGRIDVVVTRGPHAPAASATPTVSVPVS